MTAWQVHLVSGLIWLDVVAFSSQDFFHKDVQGLKCNHTTWFPDYWMNEYCHSIDHTQPTPQGVIAVALGRIFDYLQWKRCTLIYDQSTAGLLHDMTQTGMTFNVARSYNIVNVTSLRSHDLRSQIKQFYLAETSPHDFVLFCSEECINAVIHEANVLDFHTDRYTYVRHHSRWLVLGSHDTKERLLNLGEGLDNVAVLSDPKCSEGMDVGAEANQTSEYTGGSVCLELSTLLRSPDGRVWSTVCYLDPKFNHAVEGTVFPNIMYGYNQRLFVVTTKTWLGFVRKHTDDNEPIYDGFCIEVLNELANLLNFTYVLIEPGDNEWGSEEDGVKGWSGIVGQLQRREVDFAMASLSRNSARDAVVDFVETPFFRDYKDIMYRKLNSTKSWRLLLDIFRPSVLLCIGVALLAYTSLYLLLQFGPRERREKRTCLNIANVSCYIYGALFSQGGEHLPVSASGRFLVASWWVFSIVMSATYSAKLIANLAVPRVNKPFTSTKELLENTDYTWGVVGKSSTYSLLSISKDSDIQGLWKRMVMFNKTDPSVFSRSVTDHIEKVLNEPYAYIMGHDKLGNGTDCEVSYLREKLFEYSKGMALPKHSPLKDDFDREMIHLSETGFLNRLAKKWIISSAACLEGKSAATVVTLEDMHSAFYLLLAGFGASSCILIFERLYRAMLSCRFQK